MGWQLRSDVQVLHLLWSPSQGKLVRIGQPPLTACTQHLAAPEARRLCAGLVPVHSPLLWESWLVSFPPLTDMLKFSGYSRLRSGRNVFSQKGQVPEAFGRCLLSRRLRLVPRGKSPLSILGRYNLNMPGRQTQQAVLVWITTLNQPCQRI